MLVSVFLASLVLGICIAFLIPKEYEAIARIMPPDQQNSSATLLAALAGRSGNFSALGSLAGGLLGGHTTTALFISLLQSGTVSGRLVDRFRLQDVYQKRFRTDAAKLLARRTHIEDDKRSGVITIAVTDRNPVRARDLAQAYLDELNNLVTQTSTSSARRERVFIEQRLRSVSADLEHAQQQLGDFSSRTNAIDLKEQARAIVDSGARVEADLALEQSTLNSLRQMYGDSNIRIREAEARIATLQAELRKVNGSSAGPLPDIDSNLPGSGLSPPLRQLPRLAVPYADLYRKVQVQEAVYELLTQQYETARIEEAKDVPVVSVIDVPGIPEKKSFPPRLIITLLFAFASIIVAACAILLSARWKQIPQEDHRKLLIRDIAQDIRARADLPVAGSGGPP